MTLPDGREAVLIPTGREMKSYGCMRSLSRHGIHTVVASELEWIPHFESRYCDERVQLPTHWNDIVAYKDALVELATRPDVRSIIPVRECDVYAFAAYSEEFEPHVDLVVPDAATLGTAHDRLQLAREAAKAGVPFAPTTALSKTREWDRDVVVKPRYNILTGDYLESVPREHAFEVSDIVFLPAGRQGDVDRLHERMRHDPIVQEFIPQAEKILYTALWADGEPAVTYQHRQLRTVSWIGGGGVYRESVHSEAVDEVATTLLRHLDWHGYACIEYLKDERTGEWKFLEINPRVWLSLPEALRSGVDFPYHYWRHATGDPFETVPDYPTGTRCHIAYGELKHLLSVRRDETPFAEPPSFGRTFLEIAGSCVRYPRFDYLRRDDPRFVLASIRALAGLDTDGRYDSVL